MFKDFSACRIVLAANQQNPGNIQRLSPAELSKPQINNILEYSRTFPPAEMSEPQINNVFENIQRLFRLQNCLSRKSTLSSKIFKDFSTCRIVLVANQQYTGNVQRLFRLQNCLSRKSTIYPGNIQGLFRLQK